MDFDQDTKSDICPDCNGTGHLVREPFSARDQFYLRAILVIVGLIVVVAVYFYGPHFWGYQELLAFGCMFVLAGVFPAILAALGMNLKTGKLMCLNCDGSGKKPA